jgi:dTDP-4-dehydrorhamnose reductase
MAQALATDGSYDHPVLRAPGWWRRPERLWYPAEGAVAPAPRSTARPLLVTGATGTLGRAFARLCELRGLPFVLTSRSELDITDPASALAAVRPWAVVNAAGYVRVDDAEHERERCFRENATGAAVLARECARRRLPLVTFSSDLVFDGAKGAPYVESDSVAPLNVYGASKAEAERRVLGEHPAALVVRTSAFFGPWDEWNFAHAVLRDLEAGRTFAAVDDLVVSPTYVPDLVDATLDLLIDGESGIWHLANEGAVTWAAFARMVAAAAGFDTAAIRADRTSFVAPRPRYSALGSERAWLLRSLETAVQTFAHTRSGGMRVADWTTVNGVTVSSGSHSSNSSSIQTQLE